MLVLLGGGFGFGIRSGGLGAERFSPLRWTGEDFAVAASACWNLGDGWVWGFWSLWGEQWM